MGNPGIPKNKNITISRSEILSKLRVVDDDVNIRNRIMKLENLFRQRVDSHITSLPTSKSKFDKFNTSPFVLLIHARQRGYSRISQIEGDIVPAKAFSSMETSAGRLMETITLPVYGWEVVESQMQSKSSEIDGRKIDKNVARLATLKSGPRCINDTQSKEMAKEIVSNYLSWAHEYNVNQLDISYGALYGTYKKSMKKDWHILRNIYESIGSSKFTQGPNGNWSIMFNNSNIKVSVSIRIGKDWWDYLGGETCLIEMCIALIRACVTPGDADEITREYEISDLADIVDQSAVPEDYNVSILQKSQYPWLFFILRHFCDELI